MSWYDWTVALHVIAVIAWMAGLLYLPRLYAYHTRLRVGRDRIGHARILAADSFQDFLTDIRIRNYSPSETPTLAGTPTPTATASATPLPTFTPTVTYTPALPPTPLPTNPAVLRTSDIGLHFGKGALTVAVVFAFFGLFLAVSKKFRS